MCEDRAGLPPGQPSGPPSGLSPGLSPSARRTVEATPPPPGDTSVSAADVALVGMASAAAETGATSRADSGAAAAGEALAVVGGPAWGSSVTETGPADCARSTPWSPAEAALLAALPAPGQDLEDRVWCELEAGHTGPHHGLGQISGPHWWWLRWQEDHGDDPPARREFVSLGFCGDAGPGGVECSLPAGHVGAHSYRLRPD